MGLAICEGAWAPGHRPAAARLSSLNRLMRSRSASSANARAARIRALAGVLPSLIIERSTFFTSSGSFSSPAVSSPIGVLPKKNCTLPPGSRAENNRKPRFAQKRGEIYSGQRRVAPQLPFSTEGAPRGSRKTVVPCRSLRVVVLAIRPQVRRIQPEIGALADGDHMIDLFRREGAARG